MPKFRKCECVNVEYGSYDNQVNLKIPLDLDIRYNDRESTPRLKVCVDKCIAKEIQGLWALGIRTTGCCCNHNKEINYPFISVVDEDIEKMLDFGYFIVPHAEMPTRKDEFFAKTLLLLENEEVDSSILQHINTVFYISKNGNEKASIPKMVDKEIIYFAPINDLLLF